MSDNQIPQADPRVRDTEEAPRLNKQSLDILARLTHLHLHDVAYDVKEGEAIHLHPSTFGDILDNSIGLIDPNCTPQVCGWIDGKAVVLNTDIPKDSVEVRPTKLSSLSLSLDRQSVVDYLNKCHKADPSMIQGICSQGVVVTCLSDENPIAVEPGLDGVMVTSGLGLINGLLGYLGVKPIYACTEGEVGSEVITHFEV